jgi:SMC interacting uncharacterized protein involved in chromosome segregation
MPLLSLTDTFNVSSVSTSELHNILKYATFPYLHIIIRTKSNIIFPSYLTLTLQMKHFLLKHITRSLPRTSLATEVVSRESEP